MKKPKMKLIKKSLICNRIKNHEIGMKLTKEL